MPDQQVVLADVEWQQLLAIVCNAQGPGINWAVVNPLVMKLGEQLRAQTLTPQPMQNPYDNQIRPNGLDEDEPVVRRVPRPQ